MEAFVKPLLNPELPPPPGLKAWNGSDPGVRYAVYRNNVVMSLIDALADTFPVVRQLVGEAFFRAMACEYIYRHPPRSPVLARYGEGFADFVAGFEPAFCVPYLADVARLEWAWVCAFHAADARSLPVQEMAKLLDQPERLPATRLLFAPSAHLLRSEFAVVSIWQAHQADGKLGGIDTMQAEAALVVRPQLEVQLIPLSLSAAVFLGELMTGRSLGTACEQWLGGGALDIAEIFSLLLQTESLAGLETQGVSSGKALP